MITHTTPNGLIYQIHPSPAECNRRIATLIRRLYPTYLQIRATAVGATPRGCPLPSPEPASGAERHRTSTIDGGSPIATSQPRSPARFSEPTRS